MDSSKKICIFAYCRVASKEQLIEKPQLGLPSKAEQEVRKNA